MGQRCRKAEDISFKNTKTSTVILAKLLKLMGQTGAPDFWPTSLTSRLTSWQKSREDASQGPEWNGWFGWDWRMRICDHQDAVCGNLSAAPPFRLTQFYISWQTNCLRDMCAPQIVYDAFELSFKQGAKKTSKRRKNLVVQRSSELQIQLWPIWWGERAK